MSTGDPNQHHLITEGDYEEDPTTLDRMKEGAGNAKKKNVQL